MNGSSAATLSEIKPGFSGVVYSSEKKIAPLFAELNVTASEFIPFNKISLNIQAEEFTPMREQPVKTLVSGNSADNVAKIVEFIPLPSHQTILRESDIHVLPPSDSTKESTSANEDLEMEKKKKYDSKSPTISIDTVKLEASKGDIHEVDLIDSPNSNSKHAYSIDEIMLCFKEISQYEEFKAISKKLNEFSHRKLQIYKVSYKGNQKKQKIRKELLRTEEFKAAEFDNWRKAKSIEEEKIKEKAKITTLKLTTTVDDREKIKRKIKITLNKLSPSNFEKLQKEIMELGKQSREALCFLVQTIFEKSCFEPKYTAMYAQLCGILKQEFEGLLFEGESPSKRSQNWFKYILLQCIQDIFNISSEAALTEEAKVSKKKAHGNVRFIGELLKVGLITAKIIQDIVETLINFNNCTPENIDPDKIEIACVLISTAGAYNEKQKLVGETNKIFQFLGAIIEYNKSISNKLKFMIMNLFDERARKWVKDASEAPKTVEEIRNEFQSEQAEIQQRNRY